MNPVSVRTTLGLTATLLGAASQSVTAASVDAAPGFFFSTLPFSDTGTTIGMVSDIDSIPEDVMVPNLYRFVLGPDVFYFFNVLTGGTMTFRVTPTGTTGYDPSLYLLTGGPLGANALLGRDAAVANLAEALTNIPVSPGTWYLVIDSFYSSGIHSAGNYTLDVTGSGVVLGPAVPEPGSAMLGLTALSGVLWRRRRRGAC